MIDIDALRKLIEDAQQYLQKHYILAQKVYEIKAQLKETLSKYLVEMPDDPDEETQFLIAEAQNLFEEVKKISAGIALQEYRKRIGKYPDSLLQITGEYKSPISILSAEVLAIILSYLPNNQLVAARRVDKKFNDVILDILSLTKNPCLLTFALTEQTTSLVKVIFNTPVNTESFQIINEQDRKTIAKIIYKDHEISIWPIIKKKVERFNKKFMDGVGIASSLFALGCIAFLGDTLSKIENRSDMIAVAVVLSIISTFWLIGTCWVGVRLFCPSDSTLFQFSIDNIRNEGGKRRAKSKLHKEINKKLDELQHHFQRIQKKYDHVQFLPFYSKKPNKDHHVISINDVSDEEQQAIATEISRIEYRK